MGIAICSIWENLVNSLAEFPYISESKEEFDYETAADVVVLILEKGEASVDLYKFARQLGFREIPILDDVAPFGFILVGSAAAIDDFRKSGNLQSAGTQAGLAIGKDFVVDTMAVEAGSSAATIHPLAGLATYIACQWQCENIPKAYYDLMSGSLEAQLRMAEYVEAENEFLAAQMRFNPSFMNPWTKSFDLP